jgi:hypothetical protein
VDEEEANNNGKEPFFASQRTKLFLAGVVLLILTFLVDIGKEQLGLNISTESLETLSMDITLLILGLIGARTLRNTSTK